MGSGSQIPAGGPPAGHGREDLRRVMDVETSGDWLVSLVARRSSLAARNLGIPLCLLTYFTLLTLLTYFTYLPVSKCIFSPSRCPREKRDERRSTVGMIE